MFVLLQIHPIGSFHFDRETGGAREGDTIDVLAIDETREGLEGYLAAYEFRFAAACRELEAWDCEIDDGGTLDECEDKMAAIASKHRICLAAVCNQFDIGRATYGRYLTNTIFRIVECLGPERKQGDSTSSVVSLKSRPPKAASR